MAVSLSHDNDTVSKFRSMLSSNDRIPFIAVTCMMCDNSIGICDHLDINKAKVSLRACDIKVGVTVCYGCGVRSKFGRVYSAIDVNRLNSKVLVKRLHEEAVRHNCSVEYIPNMVYLKLVVQELSFRMFSIIPGPAKGMGLRLGDAVHTDLIRS